jgi:predicted dehydrogenase
VAGLTRCFTQARVNTPRPVWNPDIRQPTNFFEQWQEVPDNQPAENGFKVQWELFIRHLCEGGPFKWDLLAGARGVQLAEAGLQSWRERRWIDLPKLQA